MRLPLPALPFPRPGGPTGPRVVLVTGASSGIGRAVAHRCAEAGDHLVLAARDEGSLKEAADECEDRGAGSVTVVPCDVGDDGDVERLVARVVSRHGRLDAVAHCAAVVAYGRTEELPAELFDAVLRTNLSGSVNVARHSVRLMRRQRHGALVLVGSVIGHIAAPTMSAYAVSKWGVRSLARQLQVENRDERGVSISYVAPGGVLTPIYEQAANHAGWAGRPPPPVDPPEKIARVIVERFESPRHRTQVGAANDLIRFGFSFMPGVYDFLVGPLFTLAATDRTHPEEPNPGNVLTSQPELNRLLGDQVGALAGLARNLDAVVRGALRGGG
ncbi:SDR family NAD(P)-dependent oxidoreductase [Nocardioides caldifontis]|uniref:SDR family NAD(P)-dependent oxidoreductase n=1 Tax=Nocardioides caldifontis TaxID=2588938 RepID=UPI0011E05C97|nr:SDR family NAD(P)-dependent oxidoreductase [Nocardioides caldifontis]